MYCCAEQMCTGGTDNLTYTYDTANLQLTSVADGGTSAGFVGGTGNYVYDANSGNLTTDPYKHLGIIYDVLNRTDKITVTNATNRYIDYTYGADGSLLRKRQYDNGILIKTSLSEVSTSDAYARRLCLLSEKPSFPR